MLDESPADRFRLALQMHDLGVKMYRARLLRERPSATDDEIELAVQEWLLSQPDAALGDAASRRSSRFS